MIKPVKRISLARSVFISKYRFLIGQLEMASDWLKFCLENSLKRELETEYESNPNKKPMSEILSNIDFDAFKERVNVENGRSSAAQAAKAAEAEAQLKEDNLTSQNPGIPNQNNVSNLLAQMRGNYSLSSMINGFGSSPLSSMASGRSAPYGGLSGGFLQPQAKSTPTPKPRDYSTITPSSYSSPSSSSTDLIYRCPIIECGKAFSKLGGIFKVIQFEIFKIKHLGQSRDRISAYIRASLQHCTSSESTFDSVWRL